MEVLGLVQAQLSAKILELLPKKSVRCTARLLEKKLQSLYPDVTVTHVKSRKGCKSVTLCGILVLTHWKTMVHVHKTLEDWMLHKWFGTDLKDNWNIGNAGDGERGCQGEAVSVKHEPVVDAQGLVFEDVTSSGLDVHSMRIDRFGGQSPGDDGAQSGAVTTRESNHANEDPSAFWSPSVEPPEKGTGALHMGGSENGQEGNTAGHCKVEGDEREEAWAEEEMECGQGAMEVKDGEPAAEDDEDEDDIDDDDDDDGERGITFDLSNVDMDVVGDNDDVNDDEEGRERADSPTIRSRKSCRKPYMSRKIYVQVDDSASEEAAEDGEGRSTTSRDGAWGPAPSSYHKHVVRNENTSHLDYKCKYCDYCSKYFKNIKTHLRRFHLKKKFRCDDCGKLFGMNHDLTSHKRIHEKRFRCEICEKLFSNKHLLASHERKHHPGEAEQRAGETFASERRRRNGSRPSAVSCSQCDFVTVKEYYLALHVKRRHAEKTLPCKHCDKMFGGRRDLLNHLRYHEGQQFSCDRCGQLLSSKFALETHTKRIHMGLAVDLMKRYQCSECGKVCMGKTEYTTHMNKEHLAIRPFTCDVCGKGFHGKSLLRTHKRIHRAPQFCCPDCGKMFHHRTGLKDHLVTHADSLQAAVFTCEVCDKVFTRKVSLTRHQRVHTGAKPYKCQLCASAFSDYSILRRHVKGVHKIDDKSLVRHSHSNRRSGAPDGGAGADADAGAGAGADAGGNDATGVACGRNDAGVSVALPAARGTPALMATSTGVIAETDSATGTSGENEIPGAERKAVTRKVVPIISDISADSVADPDPPAMTAHAPPAEHGFEGPSDVQRSYAAATLTDNGSAAVTGSDPTLRGSAPQLLAHAYQSLLPS